MKLSTILTLALTTSTIIVGCGTNETTNTPIADDTIENQIVVNRAPVASDKLLPLSTNTAGSFTLTAADADNDPIIFEQLSQPQHGTITTFDKTSGTFTYLPEDGFSGVDKFTYSVSDGVSKCPSKTVTINVAKTQQPIPLTPSDLVITPGCVCGAKLTWQDNANNEDGFEIYQNGKLICVKDADETSMMVTGLKASTTYTFEVRAKNASGKSEAITAEFTTNAVQTKPQAPTDLKISAKDDTSVRLSWKDNADNEAGYEIYQNGTLLKTISANCACTLIGGLQPNTSYTFEVKAKNNVGISLGASLTSSTKPEKETPPIEEPTLNEAPTVTTDANKVITLGESVAISATASDSDGTITKFLWKEGDNTLSDTKDFNYTPTTTGNHFLIITVTDDDNATASAPVKVVVKEKIIPVVPNQAPTANAGEDKEVEEKKSITLTGIGADSDGTIASYKWEEAGIVLGTSAILNYTPSSDGTYTLTFTVTDNKGLSASDTVVITATPAPDTTKPIITLHDTASLSLIVGASYSHANVTANDEEDGDITSRLVTTGSVDTSQAGTYIIKYNVSDEAGNAADEVTRTVVVTEQEVENQAPTANAGEDKSIEVNKNITLTGSGIDPEGKTLTFSWKKGDETLSSQATLTFKPLIVGTTTLTFTVTDEEDLSATDTVVVTATEAPDTIKPVILRQGTATLNLTVGDTYTDAGSTASDDRDGDITNKIVTTGSVDTSQAGTYIIKYNVSDEAGNAADEVTRTVVVTEQEVENQVPKVTNVTIAGTAKIGETLTGNYIYSDEEGDLETASQYQWLRDGAPIVGATNKTYTLTGADSEKNISFRVTPVSAHAPTTGLTVTSSAVEVLNQAPTANAGVDKSIEVNKTLTLTGNGSDSDGTIASYKWTEAGVELATTAVLTYTPSTVGNHTLILTVLDNKGLSASDTVIVTATTAPVLDTTAPVIILNGSTTINLSVGDAFTDLGATASDDIDGVITSNISAISTVDTTQAGTYTIKYNVDDEAGNHAIEVIRTVVVAEVAIFSANEINDAINEHNTERTAVGISAQMAWSQVIADDAQSYADEIANSGVWGHDPKNSAGYANGSYGENLYAGTAKPTLKQATESWASEKADYTYGVVGDDATCETGKMCGHYTQIIWENTSKVGCGIAQYQTGTYKDWFVVVCKYKTPGNYVGEHPY